MQRKFDLTFTALQLPLDAFALVGAGFSAYALRYHPAFIEFRPLFTQINFERYALTTALFAAAWLLIFAFSGLYTTRQRRAWEEIGRIAVACTAGTALVIVLVFFQREFTTSRFIVLAVWILSIAFVGFERLLLRVVRHELLRGGFGHRRTVLIGRGKTADALADLYRRAPILGYTVVRRFNGWSAQTQHDLLRLIRLGKIDEVLLADPDIEKQNALELIALADEYHLRFRYLADLFAASITNVDVRMDGGIPVLDVKRTPLDGWGRIFKRTFDILGALLLIIVTSPLMALGALLVKLSSRGPILYATRADGGGEPLQRIGEHGKPFHFFKFRSMIVGADKRHQDPVLLKQYGVLRSGPLVKIKRDPRITPIGRFLRASSIDELPQLFLVLKGDMSLVGPRPHMPEEVRLYKPHHRRVLAIKPGLTGMAQISGRANLDFEDEVKLDAWYIEHWSPFLDLWILLKTPFVVLSKKGAY